MSDIETKRISELIAAQDISDSDLFVIEQGGAAKKALGSVVKEAIGGSSLPSGGTPGQVLTKTANGTEWGDVSGLPDGGSNGQVLTKTSDGATWSDAGTPTQAQTNAALADYLDEHPEAVTNIPDRIKQALLACFQKVAWVDANGQTYYQNLYNAFVNKEVLSIAAVFTQGSAVIYDTDTLDDLKQYLTVTANHDDSTTETVTDYVLSGTLAAGTSTITVSFGGKTTTFNVAVTRLEIKVYKGKGVSGTSITDNANRALSAPFAFDNVAPISLEYPDYSSTKIGFKNTIGNTTTIDTAAFSVGLESDVGKSSTTKLATAWLVDSEKNILLGKNAQNIFYAYTFAQTSGYARLLFANESDIAIPISETIEGIIYINDIPYHLAEDDISNFE